METCTEEVGLLKKKPCGEAAVTHCANCEQPLCSKHAVPALSAGGSKTGKFMCKECHVAAKEHDKAVAAVAKKPSAPAAAPGAPKPPAAAANPQPGKPAAPAPKPENSLGAIDFTPGDKPK